MRHGWKRVGAIAVPALLVAGLLTTGPASASSSAGAAKARPVVGRTDAGFGRSDSVLSHRLSQLTTSSMQALSASDRSSSVGLPASGPGSLLLSRDGYIVTIDVADTSAATQQALQQAGAKVGVVNDAKHLIEASVPAGSLVAVGSVAGVQAVHEELTPRSASASEASRLATAGAASAGPVAQVGACNPIVTEGDAQVRANTARANFGLDGAGVKVGVLSDSFNAGGGAATGVANGELPGTGNPCGHITPVQNLQESTSGGADEGRGMSELVHDLAPESPLAFASAFNGEQQFATNIRSLASAGAKVIVDDVSYYDEPMYQDGDVAKAVNDVTAQGVTYYSSAGNENILDSSNRDVGSYEAGSYRPTTCPAVNNSGYTFAGDGYSDCHDFDPGPGVSSSDTLDAAAGQIGITMGWNEPEYGAVTDLDIFVIDTSTNLIVAASQTAQDNGTAPGHTWIPTEFTGMDLPGQYKIVVARYKNATNHPGGGTPKFKFIMFGGTFSITSAQFNTSSGGDVVGPTIFGHNAPLAGASVAAVPYNDSTAPEDFSSHGPASYCWAPVTGTTTPSAALGSCQSKPLDFAATDGGQTSFFYGGGPPFRFYGTSAAAPHAAAVGALMLDARPCATPAQILAAERSSARAVGAFPVGSVGSGLIDANAAVGALATCPASAASKFHAVNPTRILDSRPGNFGPFTTPWGAGTTRSVDVTNTNSSGVPDTGVSAVVLNVTVTNTSSESYLTAFPAGETQPLASNLNWSTGNTIANLVTVKVGAGGAVSFFNAGGSTDVIADVVGWYDDGVVSGGVLYNPTSPTRILESRPLPTNIGGYTTPWGSGVTRTLDVTGSTTGIVPVDATAVVLNVTVTNTTTGGYLTAFPAEAASAPTASNLNWSPGQTIPNLVTVKLGVGGANAGKIKILNSFGSTDVIADVVGYYRAGGGAAFHVLSPIRIEESRFGNGNLVGPWSGGQTRSLDVTDTHGSGVPSSGVKAVIMNVTVTGTTASSYLTLFPANLVTPPNASNLNWSPGQTIPNLTITQVPTSGSDNVKIFNAAGTTNVIADMVGWFG